MFTNEQKDSYIKSLGSHCPYCESDSIEATPNHDVDDVWYSHEISCLSCGKLWNDLYKLTDIEEI